MRDRSALLSVVFGLIACSADGHSGDASVRNLSSASFAGSAAHDPSLDTPRELPEDAGQAALAAGGHTASDDDAEHGTGAGTETAGAAAAAVPCKSLVLIADDGTFLGVASSKRYEPNGVCNPYSRYGGTNGQYSIFNQSGTYGSDQSSASAFNEVASRPPHLYCETTDERLNPISKNEFFPGAIDPEILCETLAGSGY